MSGLLLGGSGLDVSYELVDAGETFGCIVAFECHARPCLSREATSVRRQSTSRLFCFEQCDEKAVQDCESWFCPGSQRNKRVKRLSARPASSLKYVPDRASVSATN